MMLLSIMVPFVEPPELLVGVFEAVATVNELVDNLFGLGVLQKSAVFVGVSLVVFLVRRCLLDKQVCTLFVCLSVGHILRWRRWGRCVSLAVLACAGARPALDHLSMPYQ